MDTDLSIRRASAAESAWLRPWVLEHAEWDPKGPVRLPVPPESARQAPPATTDETAATLDGCWIATSGPSGSLLRGAAWVETVTPSVVALYGPRLTKGTPHDSALAFARALVARIRQDPACQFIQSLVPTQDATTTDILSGAGFQVVTAVDFLFWTATTAGVATCEPTTPAIRWDRVVRENWSDWNELLLRTYTASQDFPELQQRPSSNSTIGPPIDLEDTPGRPRATAWMVSIHDERIGGVACTIDPAGSDIHCNYLGVLPEHRGRRYGSCILQLLQRHAHEIDAHRIFAECDHRNSVALAMYHAAHFIRYDSRDLWIHWLHPADA
jgi:RimJ/RimL family protein N-acetyltransferase